MKEVTIKDLIESTGLSYFKFSLKYGIPQRTVTAWATGKRCPPEYVTSLLQYRIETEKKENENENNE